MWMLAKTILHWVMRIKKPTLEASDEKLKKIDQKESFKSDDEVGFFFEQVKKIQEILNEFKLKKIK